jgi:hypothetical protein
LLQPANKTHSKSDQIIEQNGNVILSGLFKPGDMIASKKGLMPEFGNSQESPTSILIVKRENIIKGKEIRYGNKG